MAKKSSSRPDISGGRTLARMRVSGGRDGGGKRHGRKSTWYCIGCETVASGAPCKRRTVKTEKDSPASYHRSGGFAPNELTGVRGSYPASQ